jgi:hypothetical protein
MSGVAIVCTPQGAALNIAVQSFRQVPMINVR